MTPRGQHPATPGTPRHTPGHQDRNVYQPSPGSYLHQQQERMEVCGLAPDVDDRAEGFEQDLQNDLDNERRPVRPRFPKVPRLRRINTTDLRTAA